MPESRLWAGRHIPPGVGAELRHPHIVLVGRRAVGVHRRLEVIMPWRLRRPPVIVGWLRHPPPVIIVLVGRRLGGLPIR